MATPLPTPIAPSRRSRRRHRNKNNRRSALDRQLAQLSCMEADSSYRQAAMDYLEKLLSRWALEGANPWQRPRPAVIAFGSYQLGVQRPTSDLDLLALGPPECTRDDFFVKVPALLRQEPRVSHVHPIPSAYTPVIKFTLEREDGKGTMEIDLLYARLAKPDRLRQYQQMRGSPLASTSKRIEYRIENEDLIDQDEAGVRSLNGARVSQLLLEKVPHPDLFRIVLTAVKEWAVRNGLYSNALGLLGGINWALMVAYVCITHPQETCSGTLLKQFFLTFAHWKWPKPVLLSDLQETPPPSVLPLPAWNPKRYPRDGLHLMPIVTPAYPSMNSAYNVGRSQLRRLRDELVRASQTLTTSRPDSVEALFRPSNFFTRHRHYLQVTILTLGEKHVHVEWLRLVESRLRLLIMALETPEVHAWPFGRFFHRSIDGGHESFFYIALRFAPGLEDIDLRHLTSDFLHKVNTWEGRRAGMDLQLQHVLDENMPEHVLAEFVEDELDDASKGSDTVSTASSSSSVPGGGGGGLPPHVMTKRCRVEQAA